MPTTTTRRFIPPDFTDAKFGTAAQKAEFANWLIRFIEKGFPLASFPKTKYQRLSNLFCHIAEYDRHGFHHVWFASADKQAAWCANVARFANPHGDPTSSWCDVEMAILEYLTATGRVEDDQLY
jgi:hypothetical protein